MSFVVAEILFGVLLEQPNPSVELGISSTVDDAHTATADLLEDLVLRQRLSDHANIVGELDRARPRIVNKVSESSQ